MKKISKRIENISDINGYEEIATLEQKNMKGGLTGKDTRSDGGDNSIWRKENYIGSNTEEDYEFYHKMMQQAMDDMDTNYRNRHSNAYSSHGSVKAKDLPMEREKY